MKKIYFACSISAGREHAHVYPEIVGFIKGKGAHVLSEMFADNNIKAEHGPTPDLTPREIRDRDVTMVKEADGIVAEVTIPSFGIGYEIAKAEQWHKPVLALFWTGSGRRLSPMISGDPNVTVFEYSDVSEAEAAIAKFLRSL